SMNRNVYIVGPYPEYGRMFISQSSDYKLVDTVEDADLVVFCGGEDVSPRYYGQHPHSTTHSNEKREEKEYKLYRQAKELGIPCVVICRGKQFLHVMNGVSLYQDVDGHAIAGTHSAFIVGDMVEVA